MNLNEYVRIVTLLYPPREKKSTENVPRQKQKTKKDAKASPLSRPRVISAAPDLPLSALRHFTILFSVALFFASRPDIQDSSVLTAGKKKICLFFSVFFPAADGHPQYVLPIGPRPDQRSFSDSGRIFFGQRKRAVRIKNHAPAFPVPDTDQIRSVKSFSFYYTASRYFHKQHPHHQKRRQDHDDHRCHFSSFSSPFSQDRSPTKTPASAVVHPYRCNPIVT